MNKYWIAILSLSLIVQGCTNFIEEQPIVTFHNNNVLLPEINFETSDSCRLVVEYWQAQKPSKVQRSRQSSGVDHDLILLNVTPMTKYNYIVRGMNGASSEVYEFNTGEVPSEVFKIKKNKIDTAIFKGYILIRRFYKSGADAILNNEGEIVWYHLYDTAVRRAFDWTRRHTILSIYDTARIVETDLYGNRLLDLDLHALNVPNHVHHEILYDRDENVVTLTTDSIQLDLRKFGGKKDQYIKASGILRLNKEGKVLWEWNLLRNTDPMEMVRKSKNLKENWGHANSISLCDDGNYLVSFRDFSQVWKINSQNGDVVWKLGKDGDFKMDENGYFVKQHSVHFNQLGDLMMFDNGSYDIRRDSRVLSLELDEQRKTARTKILISLPKALSSYRMCSAYRIDDGKYLVCTTKKDLLLNVLNDQGDVLWKITADNASYRAYYIENPFEGK